MQLTIFVCLGVHGQEDEGEEFGACVSSCVRRVDSHSMEYIGYTGLDICICALGKRGERGGRGKEGREGMISLLETKGNSELFTVLLKVPSS